MIRRLSDLPLLLVLIGISALAMLVPALHALALRQHQVAQAFLYSALVLLVMVVLVALALVNRPRVNAMRDQLAGLVGAFVILPLALALPVREAMPEASFFDAWFEMVSCLTTTGASLLENRMPESLHLWRAIVGWLGGYFTLVAAAAILEPLRLGGFEMMETPSSGRTITRTPITTRVADPRERMIRYGGIILPIYGTMTVVLALGLIMAGDEALVAVCHALGTLSSSGISPVGGLAGSESGLIGEALVFVFLLPALSRRAIPTDPQSGHIGRLMGDLELRSGLVIVALVTLFLFLRHWIGAIGVDSVTELRAAVATLWGAVFTVLSFLTTNGYVSANWEIVQNWTGFGGPGVILLGLAIFGGGVATTAGGVKLMRVLVLSTHTLREVERLVHPSSVGMTRSMPRQQRRRGAFVAWVFFMVFASSLAVLAAALALAGQGFDQAVALSVAMLTTTGPLAQYALQEPVIYETLGILEKSILMVGMVIGRLETLAVIALLNPEYWRR